MQTSENIIQFPLMSNEAAQRLVVNSLKIDHDGKWVNMMCAITKIPSFNLGYRTLNELTRLGVVETRKTPLKNGFGSTYYVTEYRYNSSKDSSLL